MSLPGAFSMLAGSFWEQYGMPPSSIAKLLEEPGVTLEKVLDCDEVIQECKHLNQDLTDFLVRKPNLQKMIEYVIMPPPNNNDDKAPQMKYPYVSCEVICCEVDAILSAIVEDKGLLELLFSFLDRDTPPHPGSAAYFSKVVNVLLEHKKNETIAFMRANHHVSKVVKHIRLRVMSDILCTLWRDSSDYEWLVEEKAVDQLVDKLNPNEPHDVHENVAWTLKNLIDVLPKETESAVVTDLESSRNLTKLTDAVLLQPPNLSLIGSCCNVLCALVRRSVPKTAEEKKAEKLAAKAAQQAQMNVMKSLIMGEEDNFAEHMPTLNDEKDEEDEESDENESKDPVRETNDPLPATQAHLSQLLDKLVPVLSVVPPGEMKLQHESLNPPLGIARLEACALLLSLVQSNNVQLNTRLASAHVPHAIFDLFLQYPWNSFLHRITERMVVRILKSNSVSMKTTLFEDAKLLDVLCAAADRNKIIERANEVIDRNPDVKRKQKAPRLGYMAYVVRIGNTLIELKDQPEIKARLEGNAKWEEFVKETLEPSNDKDKTQIAGRPEAGGVPGHDPMAELKALFANEDVAALLSQPHLLQQFLNMGGASFGDDDSDEDEDDDGAPRPPRPEGAKVESIDEDGDEDTDEDEAPSGSPFDMPSDDWANFDNFEVHFENSQQPRAPGGAIVEEINSDEEEEQSGKK